MVAQAVSQLYLEEKPAEDQAARMNESLEALRTHLAAFRESSYGNFVETLEATQKTTRLSLLLGIALGASRVASVFFSPLLRFSVALAGIAWIPLATLWLGFGDRAVIFIVWNAMFFALTYNAMLGVQQIPTELLRAARSMGASRPRMFVEVLLPGAMPAIVTGLRVGLGYGWRGMVAAEIIATNAMTLPQLPPKISPAASANGLVDSANWETGMIPTMAMVART